MIFSWYPGILHSQDKGFQIKLQKGQVYHEIFSKLSTDFNLHFSYPSNVGELIVQENYESKDAESLPFLKKLFFNLRLEFLLNGISDILIRPLPQSEEIQHYWISFDIRESDSDQPIPFILVHTPNLTFAEYTDQSGWCGIKIPKSEFEGTFQIYSFNYEPKAIQVDKNSTSQHLKIYLDLQDNKLPPITVLSKRNQFLHTNKEGYLNANRVGYSDKALSFYGNDPGRQVQLLAGVQAHDDKNSGLKIRGGAEEATLLLIDQTPIYKLDHILGVFSVVNGDYFDDWQLYKNSIPIQYGGKTGGMFEINSSWPDPSPKGKINLNLLYTSMIFKTGLCKNGALSLGFRKSFSTFLSSSLNDFSSRSTLLNSQPDARKNRSIVVNQPDFGFYDSQWQLGWKWKEKHTLSMQGFLSHDQLNNNYATTFRNILFLFNEKQLQEKTWSNFAGSIKYVFQHKKSDIEIQAFSTRFHEVSDLKYTITRVNAQVKRFDTLLNQNDNLIFDKGIKAFWKSKGKSGFLLGGEWIQHDNVLFFTESNTPVFEVNRVENVFSAFGSYKLPWGKYWYLQGDIRASYLTALQTYLFLPQISLTCDRGKFIYKIGTAKYSQAVRMLEFENFFGQRSTFFVLANQNSIPISTAYNSFISGQYRLKNFSILLEGYYRKTFGNLFLSRNIASLLDRNVPLALSDYTLFEGDGRFYGADLGILYQFKSWSQSYQYSLSKAENRFEYLFDNQYFPGTEDSRHQWKILQGYEWRSWSLQSALIFASGRPFTNVNSILADRDVIQLTDINPNDYQDRLPNYVRWDAVLGYNFKLKSKIRTTIEFSCFNIMNRLNVKYRQFYFQLPNNNAQNTILGNDVTQLGRTFNLSATFSFY